MSQRPRVRRKWKVLVVLLLLLLAAPPLFVWIVKVRSDRAWNEFVAKWEARGEHFDLAPLVPPKVPDADNLALHPMFAKAEDPSKPGSTDPHADFFPGQIETLFNHYIEDPANPALPKWFNLPPETAPVDFLDHLDESYQEWSTRLDALTGVVRQRERFWVEVDWSEFFLTEDLEVHSHLVSSSHARALQLRAAIRRGAGDAPGCAEDIATLLRLARAQADLPLMLDLVIQTGLTIYAVDEIGYALNTGLLAEPQLRQLDAELARTPSGPASFRETLRFERALFLNVLDRVGDNLDALPPVVAPEPITGVRRYLFRKWASANRLAICEDVQVHFLGPGGNYEDYLRCEEAIADRLDDWFAGFKAFLGHAMLGAFRTFGFSLAPQIFHTEANLRHSRLAIAIERYRLANGAPPPSLVVLVPAFLPAVPVSAYDGSAIRYELRPDGTWKLSQSIPGSTPPSSAEWPLPP